MLREKEDETHVTNAPSDRLLVESVLYSAECNKVGTILEKQEKVLAPRKKKETYEER